MVLKQSNGKKTSSSTYIQVVRSLAEVLNESSLTEIDYKEGDLHIRVCRLLSSPKIFHETVQQTPSPSSPTVISPSHESKKSHPVSSPLVGTVYLSPKPGDAPFVKVGDSVREGQILLIIEAMKVMNPIKCSVSGIVTSILVNNGSPVEYGETLLEVSSQ